MFDQFTQRVVHSIHSCFDKVERLCNKWIKVFVGSNSNAKGAPSLSKQSTEDASSISQIFAYHTHDNYDNYFALSCATAI